MYPHPPEDPSILSRGSAAPGFPCPESQTHLCHGGRWALQDGLRQELLCDVTGRRGGQGSLGKGEGPCCQMQLLGRYRKGRVLSLSQLGSLASRRPFCPRVDGLLLKGICSPGKVGSQAAALAGHGVSGDTRLVKGGGCWGHSGPMPSITVCSAEPLPPAGAGHLHPTLPRLLF